MADTKISAGTDATTLNATDKVPIANTTPEFLGGLNNEFTYKSFDLWENKKEIRCGNFYKGDI